MCLSQIGKSNPPAGGREVPNPAVSLAFCGQNDRDGGWTFRSGLAVWGGRSRLPENPCGGGPCSLARLLRKRRPGRLGQKLGYVFFIHVQAVNVCGVESLASRRPIAPCELPLERLAFGLIMRLDAQDPFPDGLEGSEVIRGESLFRRGPGVPADVAELRSSRYGRPGQFGGWSDEELEIGAPSVLAPLVGRLEQIELIRIGASASSPAVTHEVRGLVDVRPTRGLAHVSLQGRVSGRGWQGFPGERPLPLVPAGGGISLERVGVGGGCAPSARSWRDV